MFVSFCTWRRPLQSKCPTTYCNLLQLFCYVKSSPLLLTLWSQWASMTSLNSLLTAPAWFQFHTCFICDIHSTEVLRKLQLAQWIPEWHKWQSSAAVSKGYITLHHSLSNSINNVNCATLFNRYCWSHCMRVYLYYMNLECSLICSNTYLITNVVRTTLHSSRQQDGNMHSTGSSLVTS